MEALSPRSANIQFKPKSLAKKDVLVVENHKAEKPRRDKDHALAPPEVIIQPPLRPGLQPEEYRSGRLLGKGGFAICYEGELRSRQRGQSAQVFAMKIVKAVMNQKKTEEKVSPPCALSPPAFGEIQC